MSTVNVHAVITPKPEFAAQVEQEMRTMVKHSRQEEGNLRYDLLREDKDGSVRFHVQERYRDMAAVEAHRASAHYQAYRARAGDWFSEAPQVAVLTEVDVAG
ncbi:putative quinol monooxygenase [Deinococcus koreensis]|uniref:Antibiotic biosynthesis monooxygenase n=1 Tax=Deinococcus koreensis TaxID=2054903 RepID=A0A2K3UXY3_9DEIO|nr:putative quinol monooxygenase [Deinococcus koreensis]PNY81388.1 antibiotic biosynthesis monooxygenase [Deinococcus koreensis]